MDQRADTKWSLTSKDGRVQHPLLPGMIFIGRQECDIIVDSASVDKRHAVIFFNPSDRQFHVKDLNSVTGTYLNGTRIPEQTYVKLSHMDCLRFGYGHKAFYVRKGHNGPPTPEASSPKRQSPPVVGNGDIVGCEGSSTPGHQRTSPSPAASPSRCPPPSPRQQSPCTPSPAGATPEVQEEPIPPPRMRLASPPRGTGDPPSPCSPCGEGLALLQDADSLEDLSKTEEESLSTVREVLPKPPRPPSTLSWKPLPTAPCVRQAALPREEATERTPSSPADDARERSPLMLNNESPLLEATSLPSSAASPADGTACSSAERSPERPRTCPASGEQPSTGSSMAFTVPFDDDDRSSRRRFGLRDGIKKFAPPKPSSDKSTTWLRPSSARSGDAPGSKKSSPPPLGLCVETDDRRRRWSAFETRREGEKSSLENIKDSAQLSNNRSFDGHLATKLADRDERLTDSASYLIQRMLSDSPYSPSSVGQRFPGPPPPQRTPSSDARRAGEVPQLPSPGDDRSETGTYTVGTDRADPAVEEARKKIDEVFGVAPHALPPPSRTLPSNVDAKPKHGNHLSYQQQQAHSGDSGSSSPLHTQGSSSPVAFGRPKRRLPTPPTERPPPEVFNPGTGTFSRKSVGATSSSPGVSEKPPAVARTPPASPRMQRVQGRRLTSATSASGAVDGNSPHRPFPPTPRSSNVTASGTRPLQRRKPWALSSSEVDLATAVTERCGSEETASVVSDTSTEPSSHSSGSQVGPQMKLNRAFALRRARLGLGDVGGTAATKKRTASSHHGSNPNLSRQDGGRYSLRLPRGVGVARGQKMPDAVTSPADLLRVKGAQRTSTSDTERRSPHLRHNERMPYGRVSCISDGDEGGGSASPVHLGRSASFGVGDRTDGAMSSGGREAERDATTQNLCRGDTFLRTNPTGTFVRSRGDKKPGRVGKGSPAGARESGVPVQNGNKTPSSTGRRELSALDSLVISAIYQLSGKLRANARSLIERERFKYPENTDARLMIEELLPSVTDGRPGDSPPDGNLTRELSSILKNLKRTEQSLDVLNSLASSEGSSVPSSGNGRSSNSTTEMVTLTKKPSGGFFYVDV